MKAMQFLKNHYEKVILSLVLLGLVAAAVALTIQVNHVQGKLNADEKGLELPPNVPVQFRPFDPYQKAAEKGTNPPPVNLTGQHLLFNPVQWVLQPDGKLVKVDSENKLGVGAVEITKIAALNYILSLERVSGSPENPRYQLGLVRQGATEARDRNKKNLFLSTGGKTSQFAYGETNVTASLKEVKGTPAQPDELVLELSMTGEDGQPKTLVVSTNKPYSEVMGYVIDLKYPPENKEFRNVKLGDIVTFGLEAYKVIAITEKQVTFEAVRNQKRMVIKYGAAP